MTLYLVKTVTRWEEKTMADQAMVKELIRGAYDMHIHSAPDVLPRKFNDIVLAEHAVEAGANVPSLRQRG